MFIVFNLTESVRVNIAILEISDQDGPHKANFYRKYPLSTLKLQQKVL